MNHFDALCAEIDEIRRARDERRQLQAMADGATAAAQQFSKGMAALTSEMEAMLPKRRPCVILKGAVAKDVDAAIVAKAFHTLQHDQSLTPAMRGLLALKLSELADGVAAKAAPFAKALRAFTPPTPPVDKADEDDDSPRTPRALADRLKQIQASLDQHASASHVAAAERLMASADEMLRGGMDDQSMGDYGALTVMLSDLRSAIKEKRHAKR